MRKRKCPREPDRQGPAYRPPFARLDGRSPRCGALLDTRLRWLAGSAWAVSRTRGLASGNIDALVHGRALHSSATIANAKPAKQGRARAGNGTRAPHARVGETNPPGEEFLEYQFANSESKKGYPGAGYDRCKA
jgi:hypothetical protein